MCMIPDQITTVDELAIDFPEHCLPINSKKQHNHHKVREFRQWPCDSFLQIEGVVSRLLEQPFQ
jgi:hypothetical protein